MRHRGGPAIIVDVPAHREAFRWEAVAVAKARNLSGLDRDLVALSRRVDQPAGLRIAALECLAGRGGPLDERSFAFLGDHLGEATDPLLRLAAARTLEASSLSWGELLRLAGLAASAGATVLRSLLPVFARSGNREVGSALVDALERNPSAEVLSPAEPDATLEKDPTEVKERARTIREKLAARHAGTAAYLARLTAELAPLRGDADAGHELFLSTRLGCYGCHRAVGRGGTVGPDLSRIGQIRKGGTAGVDPLPRPGRRAGVPHIPGADARRPGRDRTGRLR
jgi:hypothetical protein